MKDYATIRGGAKGAIHAANERAAVLRPVLEAICAVGQPSMELIALALNDRGITASRGGPWNEDKVRKLLRRLTKLPKLVLMGRTNHVGLRNSLTVRMAKADAHAANIRPIIDKLRLSGTPTLRQIAEALNARGITAPRGGRWRDTQIRNLLLRLDRLVEVDVQRPDAK